MVKIYCKNHHNGKPLCPECIKLQDYALERLKNCPFKGDKPVCSKCHIHCYQDDYRDKIRRVMRYSGPKMLTKHPLLAINHLYKLLRKL